MNNMSSTEAAPIQSVQNVIKDGAAAIAAALEPLAVCTTSSSSTGAIASYYYSTFDGGVGWRR